MTVVELIEHLQKLPPELPVYFRDTEGDWLPCRSDDVQAKHFHEMGWLTNRSGSWYITVDNDVDPPDGVGIG